MEPFQYCVCTELDQPCVRVSARESLPPLPIRTAVRLLLETAISNQNRQMHWNFRNFNTCKKMLNVLQMTANVW